MLNLPGYAFKEQLYAGSHSVLYRAERLKDHTPVILKTVQGAYPSAPEIARLTLEYNLLRSLDVPHTVRVLDLEHERGKPVIVFEDGGGLSLERAFPERLPIGEFLALALELAAALGEIHARQIIHKDINPSNVVRYQRDGHVKLIDFGIASQLPREKVQLTSPTMLEGTLAYIAPEQTGRMNRAIDQRSDLYSLGVTLYQLLTGQLPFAASDPLELIHCHLARTPRTPQQVLPSVPQPLSLIVMNGPTCATATRSGWPARASRRLRWAATISATSCASRRSSTGATTRLSRCARRSSGWPRAGWP
jgi:serine/threonine protein kinase